MSGDPRKRPQLGRLRRFGRGDRPHRHPARHPAGHGPGGGAAAPAPDLVLVDGLQAAGSAPARPSALVRGDGTSAAVAAASVRGQGPARPDHDRLGPPLPRLRFRRPQGLRRGRPPARRCAASAPAPCTASATGPWPNWTRADSSEGLARLASRPARSAPPPRTEPAMDDSHGLGAAGRGPRRRFLESLRLPLLDRRWRRPGGEIDLVVAPGRAAGLRRGQDPRPGRPGPARGLGRAAASRRAAAPGPALADRASGRRAGRLSLRRGGHRPRRRRPRLPPAPFPREPSDPGCGARRRLRTFRGFARAPTSSGPRLAPRRDPARIVTSAARLRSRVDAGRHPRRGWAPRSTGASRIAGEEPA